MSTTPDLLYRWDAERGRMRLEPRGVPLDETTRRQLEQAIRGRYSRLLERLERKEAAVTVQFEGGNPSSRVPVRFYVRYADAGRSRNPSLILTPVDEADAGHPVREEPLEENDPLGGQPCADALIEQCEAGEQALALKRSLARRRMFRPWIAGLLEDLESRFAASSPIRLSKVDRAALAFAVGEFRTLCRERPDDLAVVVLAGYVALCEGNSREGDSEEAALYALAARGLERLFLPSQDDASMVGASDLRGTRPGDGTLRRISRMLARLLGLDDL